MTIEPEDLNTLKTLFDEKLKVFGHSMDQRDAALLEQINMRIAARFQQEIAAARAQLSAAGDNAGGEGHGGNGRIPVVSGDLSPETPPTSAASPAHRKGSPVAALASSLLTAIEADPVGAIGALLDKSFETFLKVRHALAPHPYDQALHLMQNYPQVTALWAPNPLGPWQQQVLAQSMMLGANAARQMRSSILLPPGGGEPSATQSPAPSAAPTGQSGGLLPSSPAPSPAPQPAPPPGMPYGAPAIMGTPDLVRFAEWFK